jgi:hypothetical protein
VRQEKKENDPTSQIRFSERRGSVKFWSPFSSFFKASVPPAQEEIEQHLRRLNMLLLASQQIKTMTVVEWRATDREIEMELQWFDIHRLKLTSTVYPILPSAVQSADTIGLKRHLTLTHSPSG